MGKKGAGTGVNTKVQAAREKQAVVEGAKAAKARAAEEAAEAKEWSKGANQRGSKREEDAARKQEEKNAKLAAKKALQAEEAEQLAGFKSVVVRELGGVKSKKRRMPDARSSYRNTVATRRDRKDTTVQSPGNRVVWVVQSAEGREGRATAVSRIAE